MGALPPVVVGGDGEKECECGCTAEDDVAEDVENVEPVGRRVGGVAAVWHGSLVHLPGGDHLHHITAILSNQLTSQLQTN